MAGTYFTTASPYGTADLYFRYTLAKNCSCNRLDDGSVVCAIGYTIQEDQFKGTIGCQGTASAQVSMISTSGASEIVPSVMPGSPSRLELTARVVEDGSPKPGLGISFDLSVTPYSGGHEHHGPERPKGSLSVMQGTTDANGELKVIFTAPEVAGIHTVRATCTACANGIASSEVRVKIPGLIPISPSPPQNSDGSFVYALTSVDPKHEGGGRYYKNQYYLTLDALNSLLQLIKLFKVSGWGTVALNDASLLWGGLYDINANWAVPHAGHRQGNEIDISFGRGQNPISTSKQSAFYDKFCASKSVEVPFTILHHYLVVPHFHVYLNKQKACAKTRS